MFPSLKNMISIIPFVAFSKENYISPYVNYHIIP